MIKNILHEYIERREGREEKRRTLKFSIFTQIIINITRIFWNISVPVEATAVLGAVAGFVVLLLALFLYLSRKWCFTPPSSTALFGGVCVPLCESTNSSTSQISKNIGIWVISISVPVPSCKYSPFRNSKQFSSLFEFYIFSNLR